MADEYIRKQDAFANLCNHVCGELVDPCNYQKDCKFYRIIKSIKPADIAPVVHGEWISVPETWGAFDIRYYCSECGNDAIINNRERYVLSDYCPHCGAIMDNKRGNKNV